MKKTDLKRLLCLPVSATVLFSAGFMAFADEVDEEDSIPVETVESQDEDAIVSDEEVVIEETVAEDEEEIIIEEDIEIEEEVFDTDLEEVSPLGNYTGWDGPDSLGHYQYYENGVMVKNQFKTINGKTYYLDYEGNMSVGLTYCDDGYYMFDLSGAQLTGWVEWNGHWYYFNKSNNGKAIENDWYKDSKGNYYYFNGSSCAYIDTIEEINGNYYGFDSSGKMLKNTFYEVYFDSWSSDVFYFNNNGKAARGWKIVNGKKYYFNEISDELPYMYRDCFEEIDGDWYCFDVDGAVKTGWFSFEGSYGDCWYYADSDGVLVCDDWLHSGKKWYYFDCDCQMITGLCYISSSYYYFDSNGVMKTGWVQPYKDSGSDSWYFFESNGKAAEGIKTIDGNKYVFSEGYMNVGVCESNGDWYYCNEKGIVQTNIWKKFDDNWAYFGADGKSVTEWQKISGKWYYFDANESYTPGMMVTGFITDNGKYYYFGSNGVMQTGWFKVNGKNMYANKNGDIAVGWKKISDKWYYFEDSLYSSTTFVMYTGFHVIYKDSWAYIYYFDSNGVCQNSENPVVYGYFG